MKVWNWEDAVRQSKLEPFTKLVLYTISFRLDKTGLTGAFPSYRWIAENSGLDRSTVIRHIALAVKSGFLKKTKSFRADGGQSSNRFEGTFPADVVLGRGESHSATPKEGEGGAQNDGGESHSATPIITSSLSTSEESPPLPPLPPSPAPVFPEEGAAGKEGPENPEPEPAELLKLVPPEVAGIRYRDEVIVTEALKDKARHAKLRIEQALKPGRVERMQERVMRMLRCYLSRVQDGVFFSGWRQEIDKFPYWAVDMACTQYTQTKRFRPKPADIVPLCRQKIARYEAAIKDCEDFLRRPLSKPERVLTPEEKARQCEEVDRLVEQAKAAIKAGPMHKEHHEINW